MMIIRPGNRLIIPGLQVHSPGLESGSSSFVLDGISNVAAAYSLRKLRSAYSGSAVRVRRSSDSGEQDIGFDGSGNFDSSAFSSFVGGGTGYVKTWYDQSGNARDATQTTTTKQPELSLVGVASKPSLNVPGDQSFSINFTHAASNYTFIVVSKPSIVAGYQWLTDNSGSRMILGINDTDKYMNHLGSTVESATSVDQIVSWVLKTTPQILVNGSPKTIGGTYTQLSISTPRTLFSRYLNDGSNWVGLTSELLIMDIDIGTTDHNTIGNDMATYYGLSWTTVT